MFQAVVFERLIVLYVHLVRFYRFAVYSMHYLAEMTRVWLYEDAVFLYKLRNM
jgi:hypothetical protein